MSRRAAGDVSAAVSAGAAAVEEASLALVEMTLSGLANLVERRTRARTGGAPVVHAPMDTGAGV